MTAAAPALGPSSGPAGAVLALDAATIAAAREGRRHLSLAPAELLVLLTIWTAAVQRYVRASEAEPRFRDSTPLPDRLAGRISRRRAAEVAGIPTETGRRIVVRLMAAGLVSEDDGRLHGRAGTLARLSAEGLVARQISRLAASWNPGIRIDARALAASERLAAFALANTGLALLLSLGRQYALAPAPLETFVHLLCTAPEDVPKSERAGARALGLPRQTLRRHLDQLERRSLVLRTAAGPAPAPGVVAAHVAHPEAAERLRLARALARQLAALGIAPA